MPDVKIFCLNRHNNSIKVSLISVLQMGKNTPKVKFCAQIPTASYR